MNLVNITSLRATSFVFAALVTLAILGAVDGLAAHGTHEAVLAAAAAHAKA